MDAPKKRLVSPALKKPKLPRRPKPANSLQLDSHICLKEPSKPEGSFFSSSCIKQKRGKEMKSGLPVSTRLGSLWLSFKSGGLDGN